MPPTPRPLLRGRSLGQRSRDLEPAPAGVEQAGTWDDILDLQREFGNLAVAHWITGRAGLRRLTVDEAREHTESREAKIATALRWSSAQPAEDLPYVATVVSQTIAAILGLSATEQRMAGRYGRLWTEIGLESTVSRIEATPEVEDRTRSALELTIRLVDRQLQQHAEG